jgi:hypothetical protein
MKLPREFVFKTAYRIRLLIVLALCFSLRSVWSAAELPARLSDEAFWQLVTEFSEPGGRFPSDNFVSNELATQHVLSQLTKGRKAGGAYLGVGPEQNFTYIVALEPKIAFIVDIRRQNMIEHLMYKALIELSSDRAEFLARLFSRPRPPGPPGDDKNSSIGALFDAFDQIEPDSQLFDENLSAIKDRLIKEHGFKLTKEDEASLAYVFRAFYVGGPSLGYSNVTFPVGSAAPRILPTYEELMTDTDENGQQRSYLATEENFLTLQRFEKNNLIVPLVGNFAGSAALRSVGEYLKEHNTSVSAFYTSNVEQYLFMTPDDWKNYYTNVGMLPLDWSSVFIRPLINTGSGYTASPQFRSTFHWDTLLFPMADLVAAFNAGMIGSYYDVIRLPN